ncbi:hypothetical protein N0V93_002191 [Gnomoniopsis smithogilvyi]|uniref:Uncharacterized protein n=1 Tax=Gnomoniopsis smithogilvyi TaxID=1191159 RepID=A0A9W8YUV1_9PEZI|nr:hypothetical protein N0V93_002191 [Gnomoniopsis smithogilvyi]
MRFGLVLAVLYPALAIATFDCYGDRNCCMKNHSVCNHQRGCLIECSACYEDYSIYCGDCGADCCTFAGGELVDDGTGSVYTTSTQLWGTYCKT